MTATLLHGSKSQRIIELKFAQAELSSLQSFRLSQEREQELQALSQATGLRDWHLLYRMQAAGFNHRNYHALHWLPVALVAWASHGVSSEEAQAAKLVSLYAILNGKSESVQLFKEWLNHKPSEALVHLWEDFTHQLREHQDDSQLSELGQAILYIAQKVAEASGGVFGLGRVCLAERRVLDKIRSVYGLNDPAGY